MAGMMDSRQGSVWLLLAGYLLAGCGTVPEGSPALAVLTSEPAATSVETARPPTHTVAATRSSTSERPSPSASPSSTPTATPTLEPTVTSSSTPQPPAPSMTPPPTATATSVPTVARAPAPTTAPPPPPAPASTLAPATPVSVNVSQLTPAPTRTGGPVELPAPGASDPQSIIVALVSEDLARRQALSVADIQLVSVRGMEWRNSSLDCPAPGRAYLDVITPGFQIVLEAQGRAYTYHTDARRHFVLCVNGIPQDG